MDDVKCPYCSEGQEISHDDGYGYEEDIIQEQECWNCYKTFVFTTSISFYYSASKADCLNGAEHKFKPFTSYPQIHPDQKRCVDCDYEVKGRHDPTVMEKMQKEWDKLHKNLK